LDIDIDVTFKGKAFAKKCFAIRLLLVVDFSRRWSDRERTTG
jgi:hypothetical protein